MNAGKGGRESERSARVAHTCGGKWEVRSRPTLIRFHGATIEVTQEYCVCDGCKEERVTLEQAADAQERAAAAFRRDQGLLTPDEILGIRTALGITQEQLENALGLGAKTVVRWETGRVVPNKATDNLLRLIRRDPTALAFLSGQHTSVGASDFDRAACLAALRLPRSVVEQLDLLAKSDGVDLSGYVGSLLVRHASVGAVETSLADCIRKELERFRLEFTWDVAHPPREKENWEIEHEDEYGRAA